MATKEQTAPAAHTPGPWFIDQRWSDRTGIETITAQSLIDEQAGVFIAQCGYSGGNCEANAALIAAAPQLAADRADLLAALKGLLADAEVMHARADVRGVAAPLSPAILAACAVIARVEARHG